MSSVELRLFELKDISFWNAVPGPLKGPSKSALTLGRPRLQPPPLGLGPGGGGLLTVQVQATMDKEVELTPLAPPDGPHRDAPERMPTGRQEASRLKVSLTAGHTPSSGLRPNGLYSLPKSVASWSPEGQRSWVDEPQTSLRGITRSPIAFVVARTSRR